MGFHTRPVLVLVLVCMHAAELQANLDASVSNSTEMRINFTCWCFLPVRYLSLPLQTITKGRTTWKCALSRSRLLELE